MTVIASALKHMLAAGMPHDAIVAAVSDMEAAMIGQSPVKVRTKAAIRQERYEERKRQKTSENVRNDADLTQSDEQASEMTLPDAHDVEASPLPAPSPSFPPNPQTNPTPTHTPVENTRAHEDEGSNLFGEDDEKPAEKPKASKKSKGEEPFVLPDDIPVDAWAGFEEMRRRKRAFLTDRARRGIVKKLRAFAEDGHPPGDVLDQSILNSYTDVYELKDQRNGSGNRSNSSGSGTAGPRNRSEEMDIAYDNLMSGQPVHDMGR